jgi:hypothetical protein
VVREFFSNLLEKRDRNRNAERRIAQESPVVRQRNLVFPGGRKITQALDQRHGESTPEQESEDQNRRQQHESNFQIWRWPPFVRG